MAFALLIVSLLLNQAHLVGEGWIGDFAPDPTVLLAAFAGLYGGRRSTTLLAVALGWSRAAVMIEPAGLTILATWWTVAIVASQRRSLDGRRWASFVFASALAGGALVFADWLSELCTDHSLLDGEQLLVGGVLAIPLARLIAGVGVAVRGDARG